MTISIDINPGRDAEYLRHINASFGSWGDESLFDWAFRRTAGSHAPDLMMVRDGAEVIAGSAVSYRRIRGGSREFDVGIMTGSWTLPAARGKGCFTRIIEASRQLSEDHGCALLIAFVTEDNASRRRLEAAGSKMVPSRYVFTSDERAAEQRLSVDSIEIDVSELWLRIERSRGDALHMTYPTIEDFVAQCIERPNPTSALAVGAARVIIEQTPTTDRIVVADLAGETRSDVFESLAAAAAAAERRFFAFTMGEAQFDALGYQPGFLTLLVADAQALEGATLDDLARWAIDSGDRM